MPHKTEAVSADELFSGPTALFDNLLQLQYKAITIGVQAAERWVNTEPTERIPVELDPQFVQASRAVALARLTMPRPGYYEPET